MGGSRKEKSRERKRKERERAKRLERTRQATAPLRERMRLAARGPIRECLLGGDHREEGSLLHVWVARDGPRGMALGCFVVDLGCLGVKDCVVRDDLTQDEYRALVDSAAETLPFRSCDPVLAAKIVETGVRYAARLGFRPHRDCEAGRQLFAGIDPAACTEEVRCGRGGKPFYVEGVDDDGPEIVRRLEERLGPGGFHFILRGGVGTPASEDRDFPGEDDPDPDARLWGRMRRAEGRLVGQILEYAVARSGTRFLEDAAHEYDPDGVSDRDHAQGADDGAFLPWALFNWIPRRSWTFLRQSARRPVALEFLEARGSRLDPFERRYLETVCRRPFSFYVIESAEPGSRMALRDIFSGAAYTVRERLASGIVEPGGVIYARVVPIDSVAILFGCAPLCIPPSFRLSLIDVRDELAGEGRHLPEERLLDWDRALRGAYWRIAEEIEDPTPPEVQNTDGEPLLPCRVVFELRCSVGEALAGLKRLAPGWTDEDLREETTFGPDGRPESAEFPWLVLGNRLHPSWRNTILGNLRIQGNRLEVEVNSAERAARIRGEVEKLLGDGARWRETVEEPLDELVPRPRAMRATEESRRSQGTLPNDPELRAELQRMMAAHWEAWFDTAIPALRGKTPRQAAKTPAGRERLEALLCVLGSLEGPSDLRKPDVARLREELGLAAGT